MAPQTSSKPFVATSGPSAAKKHSGDSHFMCKTCLSDCTHITNTSTRSTHSMVTRAISTSASRNAVFQTPELMENIVFQMNAEDVISARLINKAFNALIMTSPRIQRKLFMLAEPETTIWTCNHKAGKVQEERGGPKNESGTHWTFPAKLNCMLFKRVPRWANSTIQERMKMCEPVSLVARPNLAKSGSIYHKMFFSQPPTKDVQLQVYFGKFRKGPRRSTLLYYSDETVVVEVKNSAGVTLGDVLRELRQAVRQQGIVQGDGYVINLASSALRMGGVVLTTDKEAREVKKAGN